MGTTSRKNLAILSFSLFVVMLGFGMVIPVSPFFVVGPLYAGTIFDVNPGIPYLSRALILCAVFIFSLIFLKERQSAPEN